MAAEKPKVRHESSAGGIVYRRRGNATEYCLIRVGELWGFPKGLIARGETPAAAAAREVAEETGIPPADLMQRSTLPEVRYAFRWQGELVFKRVRHYLFEAPPTAKLVPQAGEVDEAAWFSAADAEKSLAFKNSIPTLRAAIALVEGGRAA
jgi:8-oxo-dGTP diphosphatase